MGLFAEPALRGECTEKPMVLLLLLCTLAISAQDNVSDRLDRLGFLKMFGTIWTVWGLDLNHKPSTLKPIIGCGGQRGAASST
jgi:hypothetical protein